MPKDKMKLSPRHKEVVDNFFGVSNLNKTDALRRAGYKHPNDRLAIFAIPAVKAEVARRQEALVERYDASYERIMDELARIAFATPLDYFEIEDDGRIVIDLRKADADALRALGEIKVTTWTQGNGEHEKEVTTVRFKQWNKQKALEALLRHSGQSREKSPLEGAGDLVDRIIAGRKRVSRED